MKKFGLISAAIAGMLLMCSCEQQLVTTNTLPQNTVSNNQASMVISANSTAASLKNTIDTFLVECDVNRFGMMRGESSISTLSIKIENNAWTITADNTDCFKSSDKVSWYNDNQPSSASDTKVGADNALTLMEIKLADLFTDTENGYAKAYLEDGRCKRVYFSENTTSAISELDSVINDESAWDSFKWQQESGISKEGYIVGTAPSID